MELLAKPGVSGIIEKVENGIDYILIQERYKIDAPNENGLIEIPAGKIREFENIFDCLRREIKEETGLNVTKIVGESESLVYKGNGYKVINYEPFSSSQNLEGTYPIMVQSFICKVQGELFLKSDESRNIRWVSLDELRELVDKNPNCFYPMHFITIQKYLNLKDQS